MTDENGGKLMLVRDNGAIDTYVISQQPILSGYVAIYNTLGSCMNLQVLTVAVMVLSPLQAISQTLCEVHEVDYFSCQVVGSKKTISVCGNIEDGKVDGSSWIQYRFGSPRKIELVFPELKNNSVPKFEGHSFSRFHMAELRFISGDVFYTVELNGKFNGEPAVDAAPRAKSSSGVTVHVGGHEHSTTFICAKVNEQKYFEPFDELAATLYRAKGDSDMLHEFYARKRQK